MEDGNFNLDNLLLAITHLFGKLIVEEEIRPLVKVYLAVKAPVKCLKKSGLTECVISKDNSDIL